MDIGVSGNGQIQGVAAEDIVAVRSNVIINKDCLAALKEMPDKSVDCCITSPPYYGLRDYGVEGRILKSMRSKIGRASCRERV